MSSPTPGPRIRNDAADSLRFVEDIKQTADKLLRDGADRGDIKLIARVVRELRYSFKVLSKFRDRRKVAIFGSARTPPTAAAYQHAIAFGQEMVKAGYMVVTGAGPGIMHAGHIGAGIEHSIGINIKLPFEQEANDIIAESEKLIDLNYFFTRKLMLIKESDALVLFPGGFGTLDEGFEALTVVQTGKSEMMPIVMLDEPGGEYWLRFQEYLDRHLLRTGMISKSDFDLFLITQSIDEAVSEITNFYRVFHSERYVRGKLVLRLQKPIGDVLFERIGIEFADILAPGGHFHRSADPHPDEANEPHLAHLHRLTIPFDRKSVGRLRQLIDLINREA